MVDKVIRIGGASGYWGDSSMATPQFLQADEVNYIVYDYLAEITMSIMARARAKYPDTGYARDFVAPVMSLNLPEIARQGVKIISNAGGVNPAACGKAVRKLISDLGLNLKVAVVLGDDMIAHKDTLSVSEMYTGENLPESSRLASINAYLGAFPIARALDAGADIVITGRCVDSAVSLAVGIHEFGWTETDWDLLSSGTLVGHILECGAQATGGNFTDWQKVKDIDNIGYPIAELHADGSFDVVKAKATGGLINVGTVTEQLVYEIGDPQAYIVPDVVCDFSDVKVTQKGENRIHVTGARGYPATDTYKVSATYTDGWRGGAFRPFVGIDAEKRAQAYVDAIFKRARKALRASNLGDFTETSVEILGAESQYGEYRNIEGPREVVLQYGVKHPEAAGISTFLKEASGLSLAKPSGGIAGFSGSRPKPSPVVRLFSFLIPKSEITIEIDMGTHMDEFKPVSTATFDPAAIQRPNEPEPPAPDTKTTSVRLIDLAWGRSGDKGDKANIGIIARDPAYLPYIKSALSNEVVADRFAHFLKGQVECFSMPGPSAINFLLHDVLGGGGIASLRNDPQGKGFAQILLDHPVEIPVSIAESLS